MPNQIINEVINGSGLTINLSIVHLMPAVGSSNKGNRKSRLTYTSIWRMLRHGRGTKQRETTVTEKAPSRQ